MLEKYNRLLITARVNQRCFAILVTFLQASVQTGELCAPSLEDVELELKRLFIQVDKGIGQYR